MRPWPRIIGFSSCSGDSGHWSRCSSRSRSSSAQRKTIFEPLGLGSTLYCDLEPIVKHRAAGYDVKLGLVLNAAAVSMKPPFGGALLTAARSSTN